MAQHNVEEALRTSGDALVQVQAEQMRYVRIWARIEPRHPHPARSLFVFGHPLNLAVVVILCTSVWVSATGGAFNPYGSEGPELEKGYVALRHFIQREEHQLNVWAEMIATHDDFITTVHEEILIDDIRLVDLDPQRRWAYMTSVDITLDHDERSLAFETLRDWISRDFDQVRVNYLDQLEIVGECRGCTSALPTALPLPEHLEACLCRLRRPARGVRRRLGPDHPWCRHLLESGASPELLARYGLRAEPHLGEAGHPGPSYQLSRPPAAPAWADQPEDAMPTTFGPRSMATPGADSAGGPGPHLSVLSEAGPSTPLRDQPRGPAPWDLPQHGDAVEEPRAPDDLPTAPGPLPQPPFQHGVPLAWHLPPAEPLDPCRIRRIKGEWPREGDWRCPACVALLFGWRNQCGTCGLIRSSADHGVCVSTPQGTLRWELHRRGEELPGATPGAASPTQGSGPPHLARSTTATRGTSPGRPAAAPPTWAEASTQTRRGTAAERRAQRERAAQRYATGGQPALEDTATLARPEPPLARADEPEASEPPSQEGPGTSAAAKRRARLERAVLRNAAQGQPAPEDTGTPALPGPSLVPSHEQDSPERPPPEGPDGAPASGRWRVKRPKGRPGRRRPRRRRRSGGGFNPYGGEGPALGGRPRSRSPRQRSGPALFAGAQSPRGGASRLPSPRTPWLATRISDAVVRYSLRHVKPEDLVAEVLRRRALLDECAEEEPCSPTESFSPPAGAGGGTDQGGAPSIGAEVPPAQNGASEAHGSHRNHTHSHGPRTGGPKEADREHQDPTAASSGSRWARTAPRTASGGWERGQERRGQPAGGRPPPQGPRKVLGKLRPSRGGVLRTPLRALAAKAAGAGVRRPLCRGHKRQHSSSSQKCDRAASHPE